MRIIGAQETTRCGTPIALIVAIALGIGYCDVQKKAEQYNQLHTADKPKEPTPIREILEEILVGIKDLAIPDSK